MQADNVEDIEVELFSRALLLRHGYDFSGYSPASFKRRVRSLTFQLGARSISELTEKLLHEHTLLPKVIAGLSVPVSDMFRNPTAFRLIREEVIPVLASYPQINIWQAGCAHGEEVYSLAIVLKEAGLYARSRIYATDLSDEALARAQEGIYPLRDARVYSENYLKAGGTGTLSDWYTAMYNHIKLDSSLREAVTFANHNLVSDGVFGEMHLILCRNVLIYFNDQLQERVLCLFRDSLVRGGYLCIGSKETLALSSVVTEFRSVMPGVPVFRRVSHA